VGQVLTEDALLRELSRLRAGVVATAAPPLATPGTPWPGTLPVMPGVVTTNGCFDLLHVGHLRYLQACKRPGEVLIVLLNSDASVRRLKGPERPIVPEADRAEVLAGLACVEYVTLFDEDTPERLLEAIHPDFHAKGAQYTEETLPEMPLFRRLGTHVRFVPMVANRSTTDLVDIIRQRYAFSQAPSPVRREG
jgi:rfaE bifunctional protein nucleotidyltransferase chain/domain